MNVVIVESAAKAKTINKYLGSGYKVIASYGHVRDLPSKDGSVEPDNDFLMHWEVDDDRSKKVMREISEAVKGAYKLILATDPDREGEAISWHLLELLAQKRVLRKDTPVERVTFNAVTKQAVLDAMRNPRHIDEPLVEAYLARRALDYLVGFTLSPVLWRKLPGARSAGRVQSVALRLVCDREAEIEAFRTDEYWTIEAAAEDGARTRTCTARLTAIAGTRSRSSTSRTRPAHGHQGGHREGPVHRRATSTRRRRSAIPIRRSPRRRCRWTPRASSASPPSRRCRSRSASTKASTSAARRSASSPTCEPTASRSCPKRCREIRDVISASYGAPVHALRPRVQDQGQERAGSPRGDPPDRSTPHPRQRAPQSRPRPGPPLRADLEAHRRQPDGIRRARADHRRHRGQGPRRQGLHAARHRLGRHLRRLPQGLRGRPRRAPAHHRQGQGRSRRRRRSGPSSAAARRRRCPDATRRSPPTSTSRSRRRATPRRRSSSAWRSSASADRPPTPRRSPSSSTATTSGSTRSASIPRTRAASSSASWKASSSATSSTTSPPTSRKSST